MILKSNGLVSVPAPDDLLDAEHDELRGDIYELNNLRVTSPIL